MKFVEGLGTDDLSQLDEGAIEALLRQERAFDGDPKQAAQLLEHFLAGQAWIKDRYPEVFADNHIPVVAYLAPNDPTRVYPPFVFLRKQKKIAIRLDCLSSDSRKSFDDVVRLANPRDHKDVVFEGHLPDHWLLSGAEEADHAAFFTERPKEGKSVQQGQLSSAAYDAQAHEFRALRRQLQLAEEAGMPQITQQRLQTRLRLAAVMPQ